MLPPVGYVKLPSGQFALDPDEQAQSVIRLIFDEFDRWGSVRGVMRHLRTQTTSSCRFDPTRGRARGCWNGGDRRAKMCVRC